MVKRTRWPAMDKNETPFAKLRAGYQVYNKTTGKSPHTVRWYDERLELFERFVGSKAALVNVTIPNARAFIAHLQERTTRHPNNPFVVNKEGTLSSSYIQGFARALRAFATWLHEDGYTDTNVLKPLKPPRIQQKLVEVLTDEEVRRLLAALDQDEPFGARNFAAIWTLLDCGLRASELCNLRTEDGHLAQGYLKVLGKGNKERLVPIGHHCEETLLRWRELRSIELVLEEVAEEFDGEAPTRPWEREALDNGKKRLEELHLAAQTYVGPVNLPKPDEEEMEQVREVIRRAAER